MTYRNQYWRRTLWTLGLLLGLVSLSWLDGRAAAAAHSASRTAGENSLVRVLNADGTLRAGASGSFDVRGYRMEYTANGAPRFVPAAAMQAGCNGWDTQFASNGLNGAVHALAVSGSALYVGGEFTLAGIVVANRVAKFNTTTNTWSALGSGGGNGVNSTVRALIVLGGDLYVGGQFTQANVGGATVNVNRVAKFNTTTNAWSALGTGGNGVNNNVNALAVLGSDLYVGGQFIQANVGSPVATPFVAKYNTTTNAWSGVVPGGGLAVNNTVHALAVLGSGLYVGGEFTNANVGGPGVSTPYVARYDTSNNTWSRLGSGIGHGVNNFVYALVALGSDLYVGGQFTQANVGGAAVNVNRVAKYNTATNTWSALGANGNGVSSHVRALAVSGNALYVGGEFTQANVGSAPVNVNRVAKYNAATNAWSTLGGSNGVNNTVSALKVIGSGVYLGGSFVLANNAASLNIGRFCVSDTAPAINAVAVTRQKGSPAANAQIATVSDAEDAENTLIVTATLVTGSGVTISGIAVNAGGNVTAQVAASCTATNSTFSLTVTDSWGNTATATLTVNVTANPAPTVGVYSNTTVTPGGSKGVIPASAPSDNGTIASVTASAAGFTGSFSGNTATGAITITGANPVGNYTVNVTVTDNCGATTQRSFTLSVNTAPAINGVVIQRQQGNPSANVLIAFVSDIDEADNNLVVTADGAATATKNGVTVSNITVTREGDVMANVVASCTASSTNFALTVTDSLGATANATLGVTVIANAAPTVGTYADTMVAPGGSTTVTPLAAPADNGSIASITATASPATFTGTLTANTLTGAVTITNANPMNSFLITVTVTDNCGQATTRTFTLTINSCGATLSKTGQNFAASGGTGTFTVTIDGACTWSAVSNDPSFITVTAPAGTVAGPQNVSFTVASHSNPTPRSGTITVAGQTFTVRQGAQFIDVPVGALFYEEIGKLSAVGITQGCGGGNYCPDSNVSRDQMAAFLSRALGVFNPPTPGAQRFADVPSSNAFYAFIEEIAVRQITLGCGGGSYCPTAFVSREQMAAFIIRALHEPGYVPPAPAAQRFTDVPSSNSFYAHIDEMAVRGITLGCGSGNYCPTDNVTRAQMAAFLVRAFNL